MDLPAHRWARGSSPLRPAELTAFRGLPGILLWLCQTRLDAICDVVLLQTCVRCATIGHLKQANTLLARIKKYATGIGLYFAYMRPPFCAKSVHDACHVSRLSSYAIEGILVLLAEDRKDIVADKKTAVIRKEDVEKLGGPGHPMINTSNKAKRLSHSTSHAETNAGCRAKELAQMVNLRFSEVLQCGMCLPFRPRISLQDLIHVQEENLLVFPIDHFTDCGDLFDLVTGTKGTPQDKQQRLYILSLREDRARGLIRRFFLISSNIMLADSLTKHMLGRRFLDFCSTGVWRTRGADKNCRMRGRLDLGRDYTEQDLVELKDLAVIGLGMVGVACVGVMSYRKREQQSSTDFSSSGSSSSSSGSSSSRSASSSGDSWRRGDDSAERESFDQKKTCQQ